MHGALIPSEEIDNFVIIRARKFTSSVRRALTRDVLQNENLAVLEWQLLFSIARFGSCHVAFVTKHTSIDPAHGSRAATALEKMGLISRCEDPKNKRRKLMSLTPNGIETVERIWPKAKQVTANFTDKLSAEDLEELKRLLDLLNGAPLITGGFDENPEEVEVLKAKENLVAE
ncbi:MAG: MarR family winged helix-turn-helix transcriptional regulator [Marinovum sp.]|nr:MarR family winged helix-turn-helix transcriptional regulator [Marinovum sp.]